MAKPWIWKDLTTKSQRAKILEMNKWIELSTLKGATDFLNKDIERLNEINKITDEYIQCVIQKQTILPRDIEMIDKLSNSVIRRIQIIDKIREDYVRKEAETIKAMIKETDEKAKIEMLEEFKNKQLKEELFINKEEKEEEVIEEKITFNI